MRHGITGQLFEIQDLAEDYKNRMEAVLYYIRKLQGVLSESDNPDLAQALGSARIYGGAVSYVQHGVEYHDIDIKITSMDYASFVGALKSTPAIMQYIVRESNTALTFLIEDREVQIIRLEGGFDFLHCEAYIDIPTASIQGSLAALDALHSRRLEVQVDQVTNVFDTLYRVQKYARRGYDYDEENIHDLLTLLQFEVKGDIDVMGQFASFTGRS